MEISFDEPVVEPDDGDSTGRTRRRVVGGVAALALVAAAVAAGYGLGRSSDDTTTEPSEESADVAQGADGAVTTEPAEATAAPPEPTVSVTSDDPDAPSTVSTIPLTDSGISSSYIASDDVGAGYVSSGGFGYAVFGSQPMELLAERTTPSGFVVRAHLGEPWEVDGGGWGIEGWQPAPWCFESGQMRVTLFGNGVVDLGGVPWYREPYNGRAVSWVRLGGVDGAPQWVVVAQTPADTTSVTVTFADGSTDTATPQNGIALLTVPGDAATEIVEGGERYWVEPTPEFEVRFDGGATPGVVTADGVGSWADDAFRSGCQPPPPPLPEAGEQPADPAGSQLQIEAAMEVLYDATRRGEGEVYVDDPTGVRAARDQVAEGPFGEQAEAAAAVVEELVFTAPTEAWFRYRIETSPVFDNRFGVAVLIDGVWKITRDTVCQDLSLAGGECGGDWNPVEPSTTPRPGG